MDAPYSFQDPYTASLTYKVYRDTWNGFYVWEQDHCLRTLHSLARNLSQETSQAGPSTSNRGTEQNNSVLDPVYSLAPEEALSPNAEEESFTVIDYNAASEAQVVTLPVKVIGIAPLFEPYAPYELCTPANRNINVGDDSEYMPFIPLVDDPNFDHLLHAGDYRYFEWQLPDRDPDLDVILTRTLHKLHHDHRLSFEAIDQTKLLRLPLSRIFHIGRRRMAGIDNSSTIFAVSRWR
ncbi:hypothetical protein D9615_006218 [Tricholomella constricta]|uniref:Uncharacterized protein n=1 Tax=Tricholomella constricta TaxID=117010 RepID=A0A8H5M490_9AGAR|nr:hypothetical protein D9615_006218 [Tricholomella constricta]